MDLLRKSCLWVMLFLGLSISASGCISCGNTLYYTNQSKDGSRTIFVYVKNCGATTPFVTHISLLRGDREIKNDGGNLFTAAGDQEAALSGLGAMAFEIIWKDNDHVIIRYDAKARVFKKIEELDGLRIQYETFDLRLDNHP